MGSMRPGSRSLPSDRRIGGRDGRTALDFPRRFAH
jgi:hypothetical protein